MRNVIQSDWTIKGERIDNQPRTGALTGRYENDVHGTWYEIQPDNKTECFWMIGEPRRV